MEQRTIARIVDIAGWIGALCILGGYALLSTTVISGDSLAYNLLMLVGGIGIAIVSYAKSALQPAILNTFFALFAVYALVRILFL